LQLAKKYNMVIISPILERDANDVMWNTTGKLLYHSQTTVTILVTVTALFLAS